MAAAKDEVGFATRIHPGLYHTEFVVGDIRSLQALPTPDILLGGYRCQPFSMGGPGSPAGDPRS
jgi:site-specific DNA-cytosine methylase